jgi:hypothetical protein
MADALSVEAIDALETAFSGILPGTVPGGLTRTLRVTPRRIRPLGMGGYVGQHVDPSAQLFGRRVAAQIEVSIAGGNDTAAGSYSATLVGEILASSRAELAQRGIHRLTGTPTDSVRSLAFDIDFEFVKLPDAGEGVIETLDLDAFANTTPYRTRSVFDFAGAPLALAPDPLADFHAEDAPGLDGGSPAGAWSFVAAAPAAIVQSAATQGGPLDLSAPEKAGAQLFFRPGGKPLALARLVLRIDFQSSDEDGVGAVFCRRAADDYLFFLASQRHAYHLFGQRTSAGWTVIASAAAGFLLGSPQRLVIAAWDTTLSASLNGRHTLSAELAVPAGAGEVGLLTHGNAGTRFTGARLIELV